MKKVNLILLCATTDIKNTFLIGMKTDIGYDQPLMLKNDMYRFRKLTQNQCVVMGRNTWEAIGSKPLPRRLNVIISSQDLDIKYLNVKVFKSFEQMFEKLKNEDFKEYYFIGGAQLIHSFNLHHTFDKMYLTVVNGNAMTKDLKTFEPITVTLPLYKYLIVSRSELLDWETSHQEQLYKTYIINLKLANS